MATVIVAELVGCPLKDDKVDCGEQQKDQEEVTFKKEIKNEELEVKGISVKEEELVDIHERFNLLEGKPPDLEIFLEKEEPVGEECEDFPNMNDSPAEEIPLEICTNVEIKTEDFEFQFVDPSTSTGNLDLEFNEDGDSFLGERMNVSIATDDSLSEEDPLELNSNMQEKVVKSFEENIPKKIYKCINKKSGSRMERQCEFKYKCGYCFELFESNVHLNEHLMKAHKDEYKKLFKCEKPRKSCEQSQRSCEHCKKSFSSKYEMKCHLLTNSAEEPLTCKNCQNAFSFKCASFRSHLSILKAEKSFKCQHCQKSYPFLNSLLIDKGEKQFTCEHCQRSFFRNQQLKRHIRTHTGEKPYTCVFCQKSFARGSTLNYHLGTHAKDKRFVCEYCGKLYNHHKDLKHHLSKYH